MIKVLVVEDSPVTRNLLVHILSSDPEINVIGTASNGERALKFLATQKPDVITMDVVMPKMDGLEATRKIMTSNPVPIVIVSASWKPKEVNKTFQSLEAGAVAFLEKPIGLKHPDYEKIAKNIVKTVKLMSEVKVVRRYTLPQRGAKALPSQPKVKPTRTPPNIKLVAIGTSTGGPLALQTILSSIPKDFSVPVLIVQHITEGFLPGMVEWLAKTTTLPIHIAVHGEQLLPGHIFFAPNGSHMGVKDGGQITIRKGGPEHGMRPSISYLFRSVAAVFGANAVGVLLTGMGRDGAKELKLMKDKGVVTIVQDKESSVINGMPGEAIKLGAASYVLPLGRISATLVSLVNKK